jgi:hypothetical protein
MKSRIWIFFDLGIRGDYESLYQFLDVRQAEECGDNVATLIYEWKKDLPTELLKELEKAVEFDKRSRIYAVFPKDSKFTGRFLKGKRKRPPWAGFAMSGSEEDIADE